MQKILQHLQQYVPCYHSQQGDKCCEQGVVGDQLTVERGINGLMEISNGFTPRERNEGIHFEVADFHGGMKFLEVRNFAKTLVLRVRPKLIPGNVLSHTVFTAQCMAQYHLKKANSESKIKSRKWLQPF